MLHDQPRSDRGERGENLIITAAIAPSVLHPKVRNASASVEATIETACACCGAGASVIHIDDSRLWSVDDWGRILDEIRGRCDAVLQADFSQRPADERSSLYDLRPDMITVSTTAYSLALPEGDVTFTDTSREIEENLRSFAKSHVKPELEIWHSGSIWRLNHFIFKGLLAPPYFLTVRFGWPGSAWSPATVEELLYRFRLLPDGCISSVSVAGKEQATLIGLTLGLGGHLRVGTRDNPYLQDEVLARDNAQLVHNLSRLGEAAGRKPASPAEARKIIGLETP